MPLRTRIPIVLLLISSATLLTPAQTPTPAQTSAPKSTAPKTVQSSPKAALVVSDYTDPCEANATTVDFDTCYADQFKLTDQDLNRLYRNTLLALEHDIADAHQRNDQSQLSYDATAIAGLRSAQAAWTKYRDLQCSAAGQQLQGGSIQPIVIHKCMILVTRHRIDEIRAAYEIGGRKLE